MMTPFEFVYLTLERFFPPLQQIVRQKLLDIAKTQHIRMEILDVGGRLSNYTIGVPSNINVTDVPRESQVQINLHLGHTDEAVDRLLRRRSNITSVRYDDMTRSKLGDNTYDCVVAMEVLEHVEEDDKFAEHVCRVLKPGRMFLMTTPNGEFVVNRNPDHKRHYTRKQLKQLLERHFDEVHVVYAVKDSGNYARGLRSWSVLRPLRTLVTMGSAWLATQESRVSMVTKQGNCTHQLIAWASKGEQAKLPASAEGRLSARAVGY